MGKHRAKQELETVPPQELGTVPLLGAKSDPKSSTISNSLVVQFLALDLLVAAVNMKCFKKVVQFLVLERQKVVQKITLQHIYIYIYIHPYIHTYTHG